MELSHDQNSAGPDHSLRRRSLFRMLTGGLGAIATVILTIPLISYVLGMRKRAVQWVPLGSVDSFPPDETRLVTFNNPVRQPWDGMAAHIGVYVRHRGEESNQDKQFLVLAANCAHLGCRFRGFRSRVYLCVLATEVFITRPANAHRDHLLVAFFTASGECATERWKFKLPIIQLCRIRLNNPHREPGSSEGAIDGTLAESNRQLA